MGLMSVTPTAEIFGSGILPSEPTFQHYEAAWNDIQMLRLLANSAIVSIAAIVGQIVLAAMAGYAFARLRFPGRNVIFGALLVTMMVPFEVLVIPLFLAVRQIPLLGGNDWFGNGGFGAINSHFGMMLPNLITVYGVFLFRQTFLGFPRELEEAAVVDGASRARFFWRILLPNARPVIITMGMLAFIWTWNDFLWPLIIARDVDMFTIQIGLSAFNEQFGTRWGPLMAGSVLATVPVLIAFLVSQKWVLGSFMRSGLKG
jgi:multiple sugar transport system permease protein